MGRNRIHGINAVTRRSKTHGSVLRVDYYHRATKTFLGTDLDEATRKAAEIDGENPRTAPPVSIFDGLCASYLASDQYRRLAPASRKLNDLYVRKLVRRFEGLPVAGITRPVVVAFREKLSKEIAVADKLPRPMRKTNLRRDEEGPMTPGVAKHMMNKLSLVLAHGVDLGIILANPAARARAGFGVKSRSTVWEKEHIEAFLDAAPAIIRTAAAVLLYNAQRPDDVVSMRWDAVRDHPDGSLRIKLQQAKTGALIEVPCHRALAAILRAVPEEERAGLLLPSPRTGVQWQYRNFSRAWDHAVLRADYRLARKLFGKGLSKEAIRPRLLKSVGVQRRDLRRTSMVRMAEAGASTAQIAGVSGHTIEQTRRILDTYIPRRAEVAAGAIRAWEELEDRQPTA